MTANYNKYVASTLKNLTAEELLKARENWDYGAKRFPEEHARAVATIEAKGLQGHREVAEYYARNKMPISDHELGVIGLYKDSTYAGAFGRGSQEVPAPAVSFYKSEGAK